MATLFAHGFHNYGIRGRQDAHDALSPLHLKATRPKPAAAWVLLDTEGKVIMSKALTEGREVIVIDKDADTVFINRE